MYTLEDESEKTKKREREIVTSHAFETEKENVNVQFFFLFPKVFSLIVWQKKNFVSAVFVSLCTYFFGGIHFSCVQNDEKICGWLFIFAKRIPMKNIACVSSKLLKLNG